MNHGIPSLKYLSADLSISMEIQPNPDFLPEEIVTYLQNVVDLRGVLQEPSKLFRKMVENGEKHRSSVNDETISDAAIREEIDASYADVEQRAGSLLSSIDSAAGAIEAEPDGEWRVYVEGKFKEQTDWLKSLLEWAQQMRGSVASFESGEQDQESSGDAGGSSEDLSEVEGVSDFEDL